MRTSQSVVSTFVEQYEPHAYQGNVFYDLIYEVAKKCKDCGGGEEVGWNVETVNSPTQHVNTYFGVSNSDSLDSSSLPITLLNTTTPKFVSTLGVDIVIRKEADGVMFSGTLKKASDGTIISTTDIQEWEEKYKNYLHMSPEAHRYYIVVNDSISSPLTISSTSDDSTLLYLSATVIVNANLSKLEFRADDILKINLSTTEGVKMSVDTTYTYSYQSSTSSTATASLLPNGVATFSQTGEISIPNYSNSVGVETFKKSSPTDFIVVGDGLRLVTFRGVVDTQFLKINCETVKFYADFGFDSIPLTAMEDPGSQYRIVLYGCKLMDLSGQEKIEANLKIDLSQPGEGPVIGDQTTLELFDSHITIE